MPYHRNQCISMLFRCKPPAATAEFEKTGKGFMAHKCVKHLLFLSPSDRLWETADSARASSGVPSPQNWPSLVLSSRSSGTPTLPTPLTNLCFGWVQCLRASFKPALYVILYY